MPDSSQRIVLTSEAGFTLLDMGFSAAGKFKLFSAIPQLNKRFIIQTLKNDISLSLGLPFANKVPLSWKLDREVYFGIRGDNESAYFVTDSTCSSLRRLELGSRRKRKVVVETKGAGYPSPDTLTIRHLTFPLTIQLVHFNKG